MSLAQKSHIGHPSPHPTVVVEEHRGARAARSWPAPAACHLTVTMVSTHPTQLRVHTHESHIFRASPWRPGSRVTIKTTSQGSSPLPTRALVLVKRMGQMLTKQNDWETRLPFKPSASARPRQTPQAQKILSNLLGCGTQRGWGLEHEKVKHHKWQSICPCSQPLFLPPSLWGCFGGWGHNIFFYFP